MVIRMIRRAAVEMNWDKMVDLAALLLYFFYEKDRFAFLILKRKIMRFERLEKAEKWKGVTSLIPNNRLPRTDLISSLRGYYIAMLNIQSLQMPRF